MGPQTVLCAVRRVVARRGLVPGPDVWLLLRHNPATDELKGYLSNGPAEMTPERLVWLAGLRWPIDQCFRDGKQLFGLGDYEGHSWQGWQGTPLPPDVTSQQFSKKTLVLLDGSVLGSRRALFTARWRQTPCRPVRTTPSTKYR